MTSTAARAVAGAVASVPPAALNCQRTRRRFFSASVGWIALLCSTFAAEARGDAFDDVQKRGVLVWGADQEGGAPYVFPDEINPNLRRGFEVELADAIAAEMGVVARLQEGQWQNIPAMLNGGRVDVALNGFEATEVRARDYLLCRPYYAYSLQLMARPDSPIKSWEAVRREGARRPVRIGVLTDSAAEIYLQKTFAGLVDVHSYNGNTEALNGAQLGQVDAALQDDCVAIYYADRFNKLVFVDRPAAGGFYVPLVKKGEVRLQEAIDRAIDKLLKNGWLEALYDRWKLSGRLQTLFLRDTPPVAPAQLKSFAELMRINFGVLVAAAGMTIFLSIASMPIAILLGMLVAIGRLYGAAPIRWVLGWYVEVIRGTPLLLQLYAIYFLLPEIGVAVQSPIIAAIAGLALNYSAYEAEIYRAGLQAVPRGQLEAALALGMTRSQAVRRILLPQAVRLVIPPVTNDFIALFKDTSVCSVVTVVELTKQYNVLAQSTGAVVSLAAATAALYMLMSYPLSVLARWSERRLQRSR